MAYFNLTRTELRARVQGALGYSGTLSATETALYNEKIDQAVLDVMTDLKLPFVREEVVYTTTADQAHIVLDEDFAGLGPADPIVYTSEGGSVMSVVGQGEFVREDDLQYTDTGTPAKGTLRYDPATARFWLYLKPIPDAVYSVRLYGFRIESELTAAHDVAAVPFPPQVLHLITLRACYHIAFIKNRDDRKVLQGEYEGELRRVARGVGDRGAGGDWRFHDPEY
ncbi:MAG TPA: hypothetical protein VM238_18400 [Phycisphaerae bacterium]|nr:hypothetical protein [Phycisphaerae bacterium]